MGAPPTTSLINLLSMTAAITLQDMQFTGEQRAHIATTLRPQN